MDDRYLSPVDGPNVELRVRGSRFLAQAYSVADEAQLQERLQARRREHHDATHHCWASRLGEPATARERSEDDGEPSGSAGRPILMALQREKLCDALIVVTRYFGGSKLGSGGLGRAYAESASRALAACGRRERFLTIPCRVECSFELLGAVEATLQRRATWCLQVTRRFEPEPCLELEILRSYGRALCQELVEATAGKARVTGP